MRHVVETCTKLAEVRKGRDGGVANTPLERQGKGDVGVEKEREEEEQNGEKMENFFLFDI